VNIQTQTQNENESKSNILQLGCVMVVGRSVLHAQGKNDEIAAGTYTYMFE
jgi:hypothetical protein